MEWTRKALKEKAKFSVKAFYWRSVLVAFVLALVSGGFGGGSGRGSDNGETTEVTGNGFVDGIGERGQMELSGTGNTGGFGRSPADGIAVHGGA